MLWGVMGFRHQFVIGDIQGCYADLQALLKQIGLMKAR